MAIDQMLVPNGFDSLPPDWDFYHLSDVCEGVVDCPHSTPQLADAGPYMVRTQDILEGVFRADKAARVTEETYAERISRAEPQHGDLLYSREGTYFGIAAEVPAGARVCLGQRMVLIRPKSDVVNFRYLRYWLNSPQMAAHIHGFRDGSVAERLNMSTIRALPVACPPMPRQLLVAQILGAIDDKIELNRCTNRVLESLSHAIFRAWFLDFEPIRAKAEGAMVFPGMQQEVFDGLPVSFSDSEVGQIPTGWEVAVLSDLVQLLGGGTPKRKVPAYWGGTIPWFSVRDAPDEHDAWVVQTEEMITEAGVANSSAKLMRAGTTIISARGTVGRLALTGVPMAMNQSCYGVQGADGIGDYFVYYMLRDAVQELRQRTHGSVFDTITRKTFDFLKRVRPPKELVQGFEAAVGPHFERMRMNVLESDRLAQCRDTLLPKLIAGVPADHSMRGVGNAG